MKNLYKAPMQRLAAFWNDNSLLQRVIRNSAHLMSGNLLSAAIGFIQGILAVRLLGIADWGLVTIVITFISNINRLFTFRMSEAVVKYTGNALTEQNAPKAAAIVKIAFLIEVGTSLAAFLLLIVLTPWAASMLTKDSATIPLFRLYGLILLTNMVAETSTGVLQLAQRFDRLARLNIIQSLVTFLVISLAYFFRGNVTAVLLAYLLGKTVNGLGLAWLAFRTLPMLIDRHWMVAPLSACPHKRSLLLFLLNTNLNSTVNLFTRDNIPLYLAALLSKIEVGYFKIALGLINLFLLPLDPFIWPTYTEIVKAISEGRWSATRVLLRQVSLLTGSIVFIIGSGLALTGWFLLPLLYGSEALPAYPLLLILLIGYGFASIFQWNRPLFLALGRPAYPLLIALLFGTVELTLIFTLSSRYGYLALGSILSGYFLLSIGWLAGRGWWELSRKHKEMQKGLR